MSQIRFAKNKLFICVHKGTKKLINNTCYLLTKQKSKNYLIISNLIEKFFFNQYIYVSLCSILK